jgi:hypothetical protein
MDLGTVLALGVIMMILPFVVVSLIIVDFAIHRLKKEQLNPLILSTVIIGSVVLMLLVILFDPSLSDPSDQTTTVLINQFTTISLIATLLVFMASPWQEGKYHQDINDIKADVKDIKSQLTGLNTILSQMGQENQSPQDHVQRPGTSGLHNGDGAEGIPTN